MTPGLDEKSYCVIKAIKLIQVDSVSDHYTKVLGHVTKTCMECIPKNDYLNGGHVLTMTSFQSKMTLCHKEQNPLFWISSFPSP